MKLSKTNADNFGFPYPLNWRGGANALKDIKVFVDLPKYHFMKIYHGGFKKDFLIIVAIRFIA